MAGGKINDRLIRNNMKFLLHWKFVFFFAPYLILYFLTAHNALFWDTLQFAGDHPNWYYDHQFRYLLLPDACDSGHPPAFGMFLALVWEVAGRSLWVSHTAMLPFILLLVVQAIRTGELLFPRQPSYSFLATLILLSESVLLTQCTLVSPDIWLMAFFLLALNAIISNKRWQLVLAVLVMGVLSTRAMMNAFVLYLFSLSYNRAAIGPGASGVFRYLLKQVLPFLPGALLALSYFAYHYYAKGWVGYPKNSTWAAGFEIVSPSRMGINVLVLGWRMVDLGKVATVFVFAIFLVRWWLRKLVIAPERKVLLQSFSVLFLGLFFITSLPLAMYQGLLTHRYFMPLSACMALLAVLLITQSRFRYKKGLIAVLVLVQLSGHFWTYPQRMSQGWEGTLGHLYFYNMRKEFRDYMEQQGIAKDQVASSSTLMQSDKKIDLGTDTVAYKDFEQDSTAYVWYCNVSNAMNNRAAYYFNNFDIVKREKRGHVEMVLFRRRSSVDTPASLLQKQNL
jgi:hypothetical protein